jgi:hypothetical protein
LSTTRAFNECGVCVDDRRVLIEGALLQTTLRAVGKEFGLDRNMLWRHKTKHLTGQAAYIENQRKALHKQVVLDAGAEALAKIKATRTDVAIPSIETPEDVLAQLRYLYGAAITTLQRADNIGDHNVVLRSIREGRDVLHLIGRTLQMFDEGGTTIDRSTKVLAVIDGMSTGDLRAFLTGESANADG